MMSENKKLKRLFSLKYILESKVYDTEEYAFDNNKKIFDTKCFSEFIFKLVKFKMHKGLNLFEDYFTAYDGFTEVNVFSNYEISNTKCFSEMHIQSIDSQTYGNLKFLKLDILDTYNDFDIEKCYILNNNNDLLTKTASELKNNENFIENDKIKSVYKYDSLYYLYNSDEENRYNSSTETDYRDLINNESYIDTTPDKKEVMIEDNDEQLNNASTAITNNITS